MTSASSSPSAATAKDRDAKDQAKGQSPAAAELESAATTVVNSRRARHQRIADLLGKHKVRSQSALADLLAAEGFTVTQATLSRDLDELGAMRIRDNDGALIYALRSEGGDGAPRPATDSGALETRLRRLLGELLVTAEGSANLVVLRTPPGAAQFLASALDHADRHGVTAGVMGTIAGDDTVLVICRDPVGGPELARRMVEAAAG
ncbi:MAG TPA: arginine repressor [Actinospica sp.]|nr:arginine repressor [Actinospica sp.]